MFPLVVLANFYFFVSLVRIDLGHWPVFNDPYLTAIPAGFQRTTIALSFIAFPFVALLGVGLSLWGHWRHADFPIWKLLAVIVTCAGLLVMMALVDPGGFLNWFVD